MKTLKEKLDGAYETLKAGLGYTNVMQAPRLDKVVVSVGVGKIDYLPEEHGEAVAERVVSFARLCGLAEEVVTVLGTAGKLHDIGKAVDHEVQGPHALIGADIARRLGRSPAIAPMASEELGSSSSASRKAVAKGVRRSMPR